ncbi:biotin--[acetyl-CoA-carboxylase] ligase [Aquibacillus sp. 3ASR75-11]|uniref:Bifunctional ligase/repressor BirA n=1 Tax=Terrihalobacillus insolitus TaxID=2950438 RepID=A0A9X3WVD7_9BACI|nr:biotin--[acetyl-CoA-carboxylase] ligase [Terrihalobacillus insolitus]MDC3424771.1 biotin--[acetyl-CoA-carboxylase] ligase [Terrihalobacillus insolitus]
MESTRNDLIELLEKNKDDYVSGQELSRQLNISRTAVWKHMKELEKDGYMIEAVSRKGYRITQFPSKLSPNTIQWGLHTNWIGKKIIHREQVDSTQIIANQLAREGAEHGTIVIADEQTAGKGRMSRPWHSAKGKGIWMSIVLRPNMMPQHAPQLTLLTATVLAECIDHYMGVRPSIKWPNDIFIHGKKTAGILTEMQAEQDRIQYVVLGIGINVNQDEHDIPPELRSIATSVKQETNQEWDLRESIQHILSGFEVSYEHYMANGFAHIKQTWEKYGYRIGETVTVETLQRTWQTVIVGIAEDGALLIKEEDGNVDKLYSAEIQW